MPRRRGSSGGRSSYRPARNPPKPANPMSPISPIPPMEPVAKTGSKSSKGRGSSLANGFGWGVGWYLGQRAMGAIFGPREVHHKVTQSVSAPTSAQSINNGSDNLGSSACDAQTSAFQECLNSNKGDISNCQYYMDMLSECRGNGSSQELQA